MGKQLISSVDIEAPVRVVWDLLVDFAAFPTWNPFIRSAQGSLQVGSRLTLRLQPARGPAVTLQPTVTEVVEEHRLRWLGHLGMRGVFDADHLFVVEPRGAARSRLVQQEHFSGVLVPFLRRSLDRGTLPAFRAMNAALKDRAERATAAHG